MPEARPCAADVDAVTSRHTLCSFARGHRVRCSQRVGHVRQVGKDHAHERDSRLQIVRTRASGNDLHRGDLAPTTVADLTGEPHAQDDSDGPRRLSVAQVYGEGCSLGAH